MSSEKCNSTTQALYYTCNNLKTSGMPFFNSLLWVVGLISAVSSLASHFCLLVLAQLAVALAFNGSPRWLKSALQTSEKTMRRAAWGGWEGKLLVPALPAGPEGWETSSSFGSSVLTCIFAIELEASKIVCFVARQQYFTSQFIFCFPQWFKIELQKTVTKGKGFPFVFFYKHATSFMA